MRTPRLPLLAVVVAMLLAPACSSTVSGTPAPAGATDIAAAEAEARGEQSADAVDACALLDPAEVEALIGPNDGPQPFAGGGDGGGCTWENPDTYYSVTVDIGDTDTAVNGVLPPWEPALGPEERLGDEMRSLGGGQVEFVADKRLCALQVATNGPGDRDQQRAIELIREVRDRL